MKEQPEEILDRCIDVARSDGDPEAVLRDHPEHADEIRSLLQMGRELEALPAPAPSTRAMMSVLARAFAQQPAPPAPARKPRLFLFRPSLWVRVAAVLFVAVAAGWGTVSLTSSAVPGDLVYPIKMLVEDVRYRLAVRPEGKADLHITFADERLKEFLTKHQQGRGVDKQLLQQMLSHTYLALETGAEVPDLERGALIERLSGACRFQMRALQSVSNGLSSDERRLLDPFIQASAKQCECLHAMKGCGANCVPTQPSVEGLQGWLARFPMSVAMTGGEGNR